MKSSAIQLKLLEEQLESQRAKLKELEGEKVATNKDKVNKIHGLVGELT